MGESACKDKLAVRIPPASDFVMNCAPCVAVVFKNESDIIQMVNSHGRQVLKLSYMKNKSIKTSGLRINPIRRLTLSKKELKMWKRISLVYQRCVGSIPGLNSSGKKDVFSVILGLSMGMKDFSSIRHLNKKQIRMVVDCWKSS
jgi:hypothetical protein